MARYSGNKQEPRSKQRKHALRKRGELDRSAKSGPRDPMYRGYAHGKDGVS